MASSHFTVASRLASSLLVGGFIWSASGLSAMAQTVSSDQIIKALAPAPLTRSLTVTQPTISEQDHTFIQGLRNRTRSLSLDESDHVAEIAKDRPKIDLDVFFDYNSASVSPKAEPQISQLADALRDPKLADSVIVLGGHTDAKGSDEYNQGLSQRRAEAVKAYLITKYNISAQNLSTAGYGKRDLKNPNNPFAAENRRVQVVNLGTSSEASR